MNIQPTLADNLSDETFCWACLHDFHPPVNDGGVSACIEQEFAATPASDLKTLLNSFLETAVSIIKAKAGVVRVLLPDEQTLQVISAVGLTGEELESERIVELACEDCSRDAFRHGLCATEVKSCMTRHGEHLHHHFHSAISIPLESNNVPKILLGVFTLFFDTPQSSSGQAAVKAISFAELLSNLIQHIKSSRDAKRAELLQERQFIANEIHDSLAQTLSYARMGATLLSDAVRGNDIVRVVKHVRDIDEALEMGQKAVRELITDFRSKMDPAGLLHALQKLVEQFRHLHNVVLDCNIRLADLDLPLEHEIQIYHIVGEALSNIVKHSNASHARLIVDHLCGYYVFTVEDNGVGTISPLEGHYGLVIMRERAQRIGGEIKVESTKGLGTLVQLFFPEPGADWRTLHD